MKKNDFIVEVAKLIEEDLQDNNILGFEIILPKKKLFSVANYLTIKELKGLSKEYSIEKEYELYKTKDSSVYYATKTLRDMICFDLETLLEYIEFKSKKEKEKGLKSGKGRKGSNLNDPNEKESLHIKLKEDMN